MSDMSDKIKVFLSRYVGFLAVGLICAIYVWSEFLNVEETGKTVHAIIFDGATSVAAGLAIQFMCSTLGILQARSDPGVIAAEKDHATAVGEVSKLDGMDALNDWCTQENRKNLRFQRTRILADVGLPYSLCFDEDGTAKEYIASIPTVDEIKTCGLRLWLTYRRIAKARVKAFRRAVFLRLSELSAGELTGEGRRGSDPFYMGRGVGDYQKQTTARSMVSKIVTSLVFGYYSMDMLVSFSFSVLLGRLAQVSIFLVFGILSFTGAQTYMTGEFRERLRSKEFFLRKFLHKLKKGGKHNERAESRGNDALPGSVEGGDEETPLDCAKHADSGIGDAAFDH